jgi:hypothetical protein
MEIVSESVGRQFRDFQNRFLETHNLELGRWLARWLAAVTGAAARPSNQTRSGASI